MNEFPTSTDFGDSETFFEIGSMSRLKRQVKFLEDDDDVDLAIGNVTQLMTVEKESEVEDDGVEGRALRQTQMQSVTKVDVGIQSQLFVPPGSTSVIYFDITNLRNEPTYYNFNVQDEKRYLRAMEPRL